MFTGGKNLPHQLMKSLSLSVSQSFGIKSCAFSSDEDSCSDSVNEEPLKQVREYKVDSIDYQEDRVFPLKWCKTSMAKNMERVSKCRAAQIEAIKVGKHNGHRQGIQSIRTRGW